MISQLAHRCPIHPHRILLGSIRQNLQVVNLGDHTLEISWTPSEEQVPARGSSIVSKNGRGTSHETWMICEHVGDRYIVMIHGICDMWVCVKMGEFTTNLVMASLRGWEPQMLRQPYAA